MWLLADLADAAGRALEDGWFVFVNLAREPRFSAMRPESVYALVGRLRRRLGDAQALSSTDKGAVIDAR